jgi:preprotein translocase subunit SecA
LEETLAKWMSETIGSTCGSRTKDPLLIYKLEAFNLFRAMIDNVNKEVISLVQRGFTSSRKPTNSRSERSASTRRLSIEQRRD